MAEMDYFSLSKNTLKDLAKHGDTEAMLTLGLNYYYKTETDSGLEKAYQYFKDAYNAGNVRAAPFIAEMLYFKQVEEPDFKTDKEYYEQAYKLYTQGAEESDMIAGHRGICKMLIIGDYLDQDIKAALKKLKKIKDLDEESAYLYDLLKSGEYASTKIKSFVKFDESLNAYEDDEDDYDDEEDEEDDEEEDGDEEEDYDDDDDEDYDEEDNCDDDEDYDEDDEADSEKDDDEEEYKDDPDFPDEERIIRWLNRNNPMNDGFAISLSTDRILESLNQELDESDIDTSYFSFYEYFSGTTVKDLIMDVIKSDDMAVEMLISLSEYYRTKFSKDLPIAAYWAHKAVVLTIAGIEKKKFEYMEGIFLLAFAYGKLGDVYFSYPCYDDGFFPNVKLAAKYYDESANIYLIEDFEYNIKAGRAYGALKQYDKMEEMFNMGNISKGQAWSGQIYFAAGDINKALKYWDKSIQGDSGLGEYFLGRYKWGTEYYDLGIRLWRQGEAKGCQECSTELANWVLSHPNSKFSEQQEYMDKLTDAYNSTKCVASNKYIFKFSNSKKLNINLTNEQRKILTFNSIYFGINDFCPYCAELGAIYFGYKGSERAKKAWGYDDNNYTEND